VSVRNRVLAATAAAATGVLVAVAPVVPAQADTIRQMSWHLRALRIDQVHKITKGNGVVVAVVDSGVEATHPDLRGQVLRGAAFGAAAASGPTADADGHGTGMAGSIAAKGGGENHALGIAPGAKILPVKVFTKRSFSTQSEDVVVDGIRWAADHGAQVINISLCIGSEPTQGVRDAVAYALSKDAVVVAGSGNRPAGNQDVCSPADIPGVIAVGATDRSGRLWSGSVTGPALALTAPGVEIIGLGSRLSGNTSGYASGTGTSEATALVSGAAALIRARYPNLKAPDVINRLIATADDAGPSGRDEQYGFGRLDILGALTAQVPGVATNPLGGPAASPSPTRAVAADDDTSGPPVAGLALLGTLVLGIPILIIMVGVAARRRQRRLATAGPAYPGGFPPPPGGWRPTGPPGYPPGPANGYPPPAGGQPAPYPAAGQPGYPAGGQPGPYPPAPQPGYPAAPQPGQHPPGSPPTTGAHPPGSPPTTGARPPAGPPPHPPAGQAPGTD
jgi:type VII secretion-associated serine protease mycosin